MEGRRHVRTKYLVLTVTVVVAVVASCLTTMARGIERGAPSAAQFKMMSEHRRFSISDKDSDKDQIIHFIQVRFWTNDDDKNDGDGISETYSVGSHVLAKDDSWHKDLHFHQGDIDYGQPFDISSFGIAAKDVGTIIYGWKMDNDDKWSCQMTVFVTLANNNVYDVGGHYYNIHGGAKEGQISLAW